jgi:hypothetical protein
MTSHPLGNVFEVMMDKGQDQIPDEGFLMTKMPMYFIVTEVRVGFNVRVRVKVRVRIKVRVRVRVKVRVRIR